jgi:hypothetical protein
VEDIKKHLVEAFVLISQISVNGDGVDVVAAARHHLRTAAQIIEDKEKEGEQDGDKSE